MRAYFLTTKRTGFSHWQESDMPLAYSLWGEPEVTRYICASGMFTDTEIEKRLRLEIENYYNYGIQYFPFFQLESEQLIGCCGLRPYGVCDNAYELGFHLRKDFWRQGYGLEAASAMIDYAFSTANAIELHAGHNPKNTASRSLLLKLGFQYVKDEFYAPTGLYHPSYIMQK